jgi:ABC-type glycerol-3-phosphate transport system substrate-binding protein
MLRFTKSISMVLLVVTVASLTLMPAAAQDDGESAHITVYISPDALGLALEEAFEAEYGDVLTIVGGPWCP